MNDTIKGNNLTYCDTPFTVFFWHSEIEFSTAQGSLSAVHISCLSRLKSGIMADAHNIKW